MLHKQHIDPECHYCCWQSGCFGLVFHLNVQYAVSWTLPLKEHLIMPFAFSWLWEWRIRALMHLLDVLSRRCYLSYWNRRWPERRAVCGGGLWWTQRSRVTGDLTTHWTETPNRALCVWRRAAKRFPMSFLMHFNTWQAILIPTLTSKNSKLNL